MKTAAAATIGIRRIGLVIRHGACQRCRNDFPFILGIHLRIAAGLHGAVHPGLGLAHDMVVCHRGANAGGTGNTKTAGQIDIHRVVSRSDAGILAGGDCRLSDVRLGPVIDAVHTYRSIDGHRLRQAAGGGNGNIRSFRFRVQRHISPGIHYRAVIDVGFGGVLLTHRQRRAAKASLCCFGHGPAIIIEKIFQEFGFFFTHENIGGILAKEIRYAARKIHCSDVGLCIDIHLSTGIYLRCRGLVFILLPDVGFRLIVIIHYGNRSCAGCIFGNALSLRPAVHQVGQSQIVSREENIL